MEDLAKYLILVLFAASVGEAVIETLFSPLLDVFALTNLRLRTLIFNWTSAVLGVVIALGFKLQLFSLLGGVGQYGPIDSVLTGVIIGRGANFVHGLITSFFLKQVETRANIDESFAQSEYYAKHTPE